MQNIDLELSSLLPDTAPTRWDAMWLYLMSGGGNDPTVDNLVPVASATLALAADNDFLSVSTGGTLNFELDAGESNANRWYLILGTLSGSNPGIALPNGGETLPVNWDGFTDLLIRNLNGSVFTDFFAQLNSNGQASARVNAPSVSTSKIGKVMTYAYCLEGTPDWDFVSNPVEIEFVP